MTSTSALTVLYNGLLQGYQFQIEAMQENGMPDSSFHFRSEKMRESLTNQIGSLSQMAYDLGNHELASTFLSVATEFGSDAITPEPL